MEHNFSHLLPPNWETKIDEWLQEDIPSFDFGGFVVGEKPEEAILFGKANGVLCGVPFVNRIFDTLGCKIKWNLNEGDKVDASKTGRVHVAVVTGAARNILLGERTALNLMARASGIATLARETQEIARSKGYKGRIAGTRKTTPGFRMVEKYALLVGGADTHRYDLSSMIMLKDNHVWSTGSITNAVKKAKVAGGFALKIEVEVQNIDEAEEAIKAGADIVMLDNFGPEKVKSAAKELKNKYKHALIEASGGVTMETLSDFFSEDVDVISMGSLTQSVPHIDFSLKIAKK
jgi:nicotinate-nucleotide pyrophosphorylase (carboxylating)